MSEAIRGERGAGGGGDSRIVGDECACPPNLCVAWEPLSRCRQWRKAPGLIGGTEVQLHPVAPLAEPPAVEWDIAPKWGAFDNDDTYDERDDCDPAQYPDCCGDHLKATFLGERWPLNAEQRPVGVDGEMRGRWRRRPRFRIFRDLRLVMDCLRGRAVRSDRWWGDVGRAGVNRDGDRREAP